MSGLSDEAAADVCARLMSCWGEQCPHTRVREALEPVITAERNRLADEIEARRDGERTMHVRIPEGSIYDAYSDAARIIRAHNT